MDLGCGSGLVGRTFEPLTGLNSSSNGSEIGQNVLSVDQIVAAAARDGQTVMIGVDVSEKIARLALRDGGYSAVVAGDLLEALQTLNAATLDQKFDLVVAADTFIYVGGLGPVFKEVFEVLRTGGFFEFTCEELLDSEKATLEVEKEVSLGNVEENEEGEIRGAVPGWGCQRLWGSARFAHSKPYLRHLARLRGFEILDERSFVLRTEETLPIPGVAYLLRKY